jgi:hypothetical protein
MIGQISRLTSQVDHFQGAIQELFVNTGGASEERSPGRNRRVPWRRHHGADLSKGRFPSTLPAPSCLARARKALAIMERDEFLARMIGALQPLPRRGLIANAAARVRLRILLPRCIRQLGAASPWGVNSMAIISP